MRGQATGVAGSPACGPEVAHIDARVAKRIDHDLKSSHGMPQRGPVLLPLACAPMQGVGIKMGHESEVSSKRYRKAGLSPCRRGMGACIL